MKHENETPAAKEQREQMQAIAVGTAVAIKQSLEGTQIGFSLVLFDKGDTEFNNMAYVADGDRLDLIKLYREVADKLEIDNQAKALAMPKKAAD